MIPLGSALNTGERAYSGTCDRKGNAMAQRAVSNVADFDICVSKRMGTLGAV